MELEATVSASVIGRAKATQSDVVILPLREVDGVAVYPEATMTIVKELRSLGVQAEFLDAPRERTFEVKKSGLETAIATFLIGVASTAGWDGIKGLLAKRAAKCLSVTYVDLEGPDDVEARAWRVDGDSKDVLKAIDRLRDDHRK